MLVEMNPSGGGGGGTEITPSNSSPVALVNGETYTANGNGYAIQSYTSKTPSSSPSSVSSGDIVKMGGSGYLINSYSSVTPSTSGTYFSAGMKNMASSGYAYSQQQKIKIGTFTASASDTTTVNVGFKPKYLCIVIQKTNAQSYLTEIYNEDSLGSGYSLYGDNGAALARHVLPSTSQYRLNSVTSSGFVFNKTASTWINGWYFAIG